MPRAHPQARRVRIIGGKWKGRKLPVAAGVRPTPNRARETLFNWLLPNLPGARVLDLFAGSGALGFEALSRGAAHATFVERDRQTARLLVEQRDLLNADATVVQAEALHWLAQTPAPRWDVVFLDPPFGAEVLEPALALAMDRLAPDGEVYVESTPHGFDAVAGLPLLAASRSADAGAVRYGLLRRAKALDA